MRLPLAGTRILDFSQNASGPMFTQILAEFGAEVIKIENPPFGDPTRHENILKNGHSSSYASRDMGKKSIILNLKDPAHKELFLKMVGTADAVVENFKAGTMAKLGLGYEDLKKVNPAIVLTSVSGYGQEGPYAMHAAYNPTVQAESGLMSITGPEGGEPTMCGAPVPDYTGGLMGCIGTLMGILNAKETGCGCHVDASMMDSVIYMYENLFSMYLNNGIVPKPIGNRFPSGSPMRDFVCRDGVSIMIVIATDAQFKSFAEMMGQPQWLEDPDYATTARRAMNHRRLDDEVAALFKKYDSRVLADRLQERKLVWGFINDFETLKDHPQVKARNLIVDSVYPDGTIFKTVANPIHMSGVTLRTSYEVFPLGYHTIEVLSEFENEDRLHEMFDPILKKCK